MKQFLSLLTILFWLFIVYPAKSQSLQTQQTCDAKVIVIGHLYSIIKRKYKSTGGKDISNLMTEMRNRVLLQLKKEHADAVVFSGDITQLGSEEEHYLVRSFVENLGVEAYYVPGNHDISSAQREKVYIDNIGYLEKVVNLQCSKLFLLNSAGGAWDQHSARQGGGLSENSIKLLQSKNKIDSNKKYHFAFMHQSLFESDIWARNTLGLYKRGPLPDDKDHPDKSMPTASKLEKQFKSSVSYLFTKHIDAIFTGDYHSKRPNSVMTDEGILSYNIGFHFVEKDSKISRPATPLKYHVLYIKDDHFAVYVREIGEH